MRTNRVLNRHPSQWIALLALIGAGVMNFITSSNAGGGAGVDIGITLKDGLGNEPVWVGLGILLFVYALIISEVVHRTLAAATGGLVAILALNYYKTGDALTLAETTTLIEWETIGLLLGMMVMVGIISQTGIFEWFAVQAYKKSKGNVWTLVVILCVVTAILSAFLDNVTTMLLLTPVTIQLARVLDLNPIPILISEVIFSNIGGTATMIGDPPNIIIGSMMSESAINKAGYSDLASQGVTFNDFIIELAPGILLTIVPTFMMIKWMYAEEFSGERIRDVEELESKYGIKDAKMLKAAGAILGLVIAGFFLNPILHISVSWVALTGAVLMLLLTSRHHLEEPLEKVEWSTLIFFAGLFVLIHSLQHLGVINWIGDQVESAIGYFSSEYQFVAALVIILWVSAIASAFIDNIPYTITMIPVVLQISDTMGLELGPLIWALAFGACLGGNGTLIGASANVVTAGMSEEAGYPISFNEFFKAGFPVMLMTVTIMTGYIVVVYLVGAVWKFAFVAIALLGVIWQYYNGKSKGKTWAEALVDSESVLSILEDE
ncbi:MAG: ArsB/NhaD family transporter [Candidatus Poseidoniales archaeon]|jgi:Na+/H+ antiporter NhaD/arsenite permease-like protein|tara:strand:+ start:797 stop:2443 length:1647 start_codon:yes stop_codon:yes gene_type:complete